MTIEASGVIISGQTFGENVAGGQVVYLKSDGKWWLAKADAEATSAGEIGIARDAVAANGTGRVVQQGYVADSTWMWTIGAPIYLSAATAGALTQTRPIGGDDIVRVMGYASGATTMYLSPTPSISAYTYEKVGYEPEPHYTAESSVLLGIGSDMGASDPTYVLDGYEGQPRTIAPNSTEFYSFTLPQATDLSGCPEMQVALWVGDDLSYIMGDVWLYLYSGVGSTDYRRWNLTATNFGSGYYRLGSHVAEAAAGAFDITAVTHALIRVHVDAAAPGAVVVAPIYAKAVKNRAIVTINFDDYYKSIYTQALPAMSARALRGVFYALTGNVDLTGVGANISTDNLHEMYALGWDIGNHTDTHPTLASSTEADARADIAAARQKLMGWGFYRSANLLATPGGSWNTDWGPDLFDLVQYVRIAESYLPTPLPASRKGGYPHSWCKNVDALTPAQVIAYIDAIIVAGGWLNLLWHQILAEGGAFMTPAEFEEVVEYIHGKVQSGDIVVLTPSEVLMQCSVSDILDERATSISVQHAGRERVFPVALE